jgi:NAD(P)-dependent dehydrogenase (short-subunit alcohol dehydrogenase family)
MGSLDGLVAIVTGAGQGLGRAHALYLAEQGASVVVNDPGVGGDGSGGDSSLAEQVVAQIKAGGGNAVANVDSCADWSAAERMVDQAVESFGKLDILVNNAGILRDRMSFKMSEDEWDAVINVHLKGHFAPSRFAAAYWRERAKAGDGKVYGRIVNTSSESGYFGMVGQVNYATAKAGIVGMTMTMARELESVGVTVNAIAPRARTRMTTGSFDGYPEAVEGQFDTRAPENISAVVAWLASPQAAHISAKVFACYAGELDLQTPIELEANISNGERAWTIEELAARADDLFKNGRTPGVTPMRSGIGGN